MAVVSAIVATISAVAATVGTVATAGTVFLGATAGGALATVVGGVVTGAVGGAIYGAGIGGAVSKFQGGSFSEGALGGAKTGFITGGVLGGIGAYSSYSAAASGETATADAISKFQAANPGSLTPVGSVPAPFASTGGSALSEGYSLAAGSIAGTTPHLAAAASALTGPAGALSLVGAATLPQVSQGFQQQVGTELPAQEEGTEPETTSGDFQATRKVGGGDVSLSGSGLARPFDPALDAGYQAPPTASSDSLVEARKSFSKARMSLKGASGLAAYSSPLPA